MAKVVVFGVGQWAELAHFYLTHDSPHEVVGVHGRSRVPRRATSTRAAGRALRRDRAAFPPARVQHVHPDELQEDEPRARREVRGRARRGYALISYVSSKATTFPGFDCGDNCFILEDNTIQPFVTIGNNVVMWSGNHIGHHTVIKDHVTITSQVVISGCCTVEPFCFFGVNATVRDETVVARETLVGMGATIAKDTKEFEIYQADRHRARRRPQRPDPQPVAQIARAERRSRS